MKKHKRTLRDQAMSAALRKMARITEGGAELEYTDMSFANGYVKGYRAAQRAAKKRGSK